MTLRFRRPIAGLAVSSAVASSCAFGAPADFDCVMDPSTVAEVAAPADGLLEAVLVRRGDFVRRGDVIARIDSELERATLALHAARAEDESEIAAQEARRDLASSRLQRTRQLAERGIVSADTLDEQEAELEVAARELSAARMRKRLAELERARAQRMVARREIESPLDGLVIERRHDAGEFLESRGAVVVIAALDPIHVETFLPVRLYGRIAVGDRALVRPAAPVGGVREGQVIVVDRVFDPASGTFGVRIALDNADGALPGGHRCTVSFDVDAAE